MFTRKVIFVSSILVVLMVKRVGLCKVILLDGKEGIVS